MPRPAKSANALKGHRTKEELRNRKAAEADSLSGLPLVERRDVKSDAVAHKEFRRVKALMGYIGKDDAVYSAVINRYSQLHAETVELKAQKEIVLKAAQTAQEAFNNIVDSLEGKEGLNRIDKFTKTITALSRQILSYDSQIMAKRKMMFDIEKENSMTVAAGLRTIPKEPPKKEDNPLMQVLSGGN